MSDTKSVMITGGAIADLGIKKTRKTKGGQKAGDGPPISSYKGASITKVGGAAALLPSSTPAAIIPNIQRVGASALPVAPVAPVVPVEPVAPVIEGGSKQIKVELKKNNSKKVLLHPKKEKKEEKQKTKKARKFILGVSSLHKRMTRAKKMQHKVKKMPLETLRKHLIDAKLIKETSKAPESILRQIAEDSQMVGKTIL
jgi:hypothetical protein